MGFLLPFCGSGNPGRFISDAFAAKPRGGRTGPTHFVARVLGFFAQSEAPIRMILIVSVDELSFAIFWVPNPGECASR